MTLDMADCKEGFWLSAKVCHCVRLLNMRPKAVQMSLHWVYSDEALRKRWQENQIHTKHTGVVICFLTTKLLKIDWIKRNIITWSMWNIHLGPHSTLLFWMNTPWHSILIITTTELIAVSVFLLVKRNVFKLLNKYQSNCKRSTSLVIGDDSITVLSVHVGWNHRSWMCCSKQIQMTRVPVD